MRKEERNKGGVNPYFIFDNQRNFYQNLPKKYCDHEEIQLTVLQLKNVISASRRCQKSLEKQLATDNIILEDLST